MSAGPRKAGTCGSGQREAGSGPAKMSDHSETGSPSEVFPCSTPGTTRDQTSSVTSDINLVDLYECPVCFKSALPPIYQCQDGHLVCSRCHPRVNSCPTCRGYLGSIRNLALEKLASSLLFPCRYASVGCLITLPPVDKERHEKLCDFRPCSCPCPGGFCKWQGELNKVIPHLNRKHRNVVTMHSEGGVFTPVGLQLPGVTDCVVIQSCFNSHFIFTVKKLKSDYGCHKFVAISELIGTRKEAEKFKYRLELKDSNRRLMWEATPPSVQDGIKTSIEKGDCLMFDCMTAKLFAKNAVLEIFVSIVMN